MIDGEEIIMEWCPAKLKRERDEPKKKLKRSARIPWMRIAPDRLAWKRMIPSKRSIKYQNNNNNKTLINFAKMQIPQSPFIRYLSDC